MTLTARARAVRGLLAATKAMLTDVGMDFEVRKMAPGDDVGDFFDAAFSSLEGKKAVVLCTSNEAVKAMVPIDDAGLVMIMPDYTSNVISINEYDNILKSIRVMLTKKDLADNPECPACLETVADSVCLACPMCWDRTCMGCVAKIALHGGSWVFSCPTCRHDVPLCIALQEADNVVLNVWPDVRSALHDTVLRSGKGKIPVTLLSESMDALPLECAATPRKLRFLGGVTVSTKLLNAASVILVGELPEKCNCCDKCSHGQMESGIMLRVRHSGEAVEIKDMFAPYSVCAARKLGLAPDEMRPDSDSDLYSVYSDESGHDSGHDSADDSPDDSTSVVDSVEVIRTP